ncbi:internalin-J [Kordia sp. SMS9]|uniref:T9SS type A sorting domain-containing protein n=1 Tax=Kordia sp. SMS9 TaxID=2282170 RepID=UPI000E0CF23D|nr:T9SS type A sorting domain-containing protein [Kordia sp. SMS9]AXG71518.1 internalin-J [Kordia sp. SMS9]
MKHKLLLILLVCAAQFGFGQIVNIPDSNFKTALLNHSPVIDTNGDNEIQVSEAFQFNGTLNVTDKNISDLTGIQAFVNITTLRANVNNLSQIDISQNVNLQTLNVRDNTLSSIDVTNNVSLRDLILNNNNISSIDVSQNLQLSSLDITQNQFTSIDVSQNILLNFLSCSLNQLTSLDVTQNSVLILLRCSFNQLTTLDVSQNTALTNLSCDGNQLTSLSINQNSALENLSCNNNQLASLDVTQNSQLKSIYCEQNQLTSIDVSQNNQLEFFYCSNNQLSSLDITQNTSLLYFICSYNQLTSLDVTQNTLLRDLRCSDNLLTTLDVSQNVSLGVFNFFDSLNCSRNLLTTLDLSNNVNLFKVILTENYFLESVNLKNGNNVNIDTLNTEGCTNLQTICVDDIGYAVINLSDNIEPQTIFVEDCNATTVDYNIITGTVALDLDNNGCDINDFSLQNFMVETTDGTNTYATFTNINGVYAIDVSNTTYTTSVINLPSYIASNPTTATSTFTGFNTTETVDFCLTPNQANIDDLRIILIPTNEARPGFDAKYQLIYQNLGIQSMTGTITLQFDDSMQSFVSSNPSTASTTANTLTFNYANLLPYESRVIQIRLNTNPPPVVNGDDILNLTAQILPIANDASPTNNTYNLDQIVVNSFDPNDKQVLQGSQITIDETDEYLDYLIRFQNTGTASAINVVVTDELSDKLDWSTLQPISSSHPYSVRITNGNFVEFIFENINLPSMMNDEPNSIGFIAFRIKPKSDVVIGDIINGEAKIYFDFNAPIITNTVSTEIVNALSVAENTNYRGFNVYPNPVVDNLMIRGTTTIETISIYDIQGKLLKEIATQNALTEKTINMNSFTTGIYFIKIGADSGVQSVKIIKK